MMCLSVDKILCENVQKNYLRGLPFASLNHTNVGSLQSTRECCLSAFTAMVRTFRGAQKCHECEHSMIVQVCGIHEFGGTGKTTFAKALYNHLYLRFESRHTCIELEEGLDQKDLVAKQQNILHHLCGIQSDIGSIAQGQQLLCDSMRQHRVLLLLDNVCHVS